MNRTFRNRAAHGRPPHARPCCSGSWCIRWRWCGMKRCGARKEGGRSVRHGSSPRRATELARAVEQLPDLGSRRSCWRPRWRSDRHSNVALPRLPGGRNPRAVAGARRCAPARSARERVFCFSTAVGASLAGGCSGSSGWTRDRREAPGAGAILWCTRLLDVRLLLPAHRAKPRQPRSVALRAAASLGEGRWHLPAGVVPLLSPALTGAALLRS